MLPITFSSLTTLLLTGIAIAQTPSLPHTGIEFLHDYAQKKRFQTQTVDTLRADIAEVMKQDLAALREEVDADAAQRTDMLSRSRFELISQDLAHFAALTGDDDAARRTALILQTLARNADEIPEPAEFEFHWWSKAVPSHAVVAYALLSDRTPSPFDPEGRAAVESWLSRPAYLVTRKGQELRLTNITPYGLRHAVGTAIVLNDPQLIRDVIRVIDRLYSAEYFHADGMWYEGAISYHAQTIGNIDGVLWLIEHLWTDPAGYTDTTLGLKLDHTNLRDRWPMLVKAKQVLKATVLPDGRRYPVGDTYGEKPRTITTDHLHNIELWHYGFFALTQGNTQNATQVGLQFSPQTLGTPFGGGHRHGDRLGMTLFAAGDEVFPDAGYAYRPPNNRYYHMNVVAHNVPWVWSADHDYKALAGLWNRPALLVYDDGKTSEGHVQLIEASVPGPPEMHVTMRRRLLMLIRVDDSRAYTIDVSHLRGGETHQWFLRQSENEDCTMTCGLPLESHEGTLKDYLESTGETRGIPDYRELMRDPQTAAGTKAFDFAWTGAGSGSTVHAFVNAVPDSDVIFSRVPRLRPTEQDASKRNDFPGWHFQRRRIVSDAETVTRFAAVYDANRAGQAATVADVVWMDNGAEVTLADGRTDHIKITLREDQPCLVEVTRYGEDKTSQWVYTLSDHTIELPLFGATRENPDVTRNSLFVRGTPADIRDLAERWITIVRGDGSARGMRVESCRSLASDLQQIKVHDDPGFEVTGSGIRELFYPHCGEVIPGGATVRIVRSQWTPAR